MKSWFIALTLARMIVSAEADPSVELRTFVADGNPESRGVSCVLVNTTDRVIEATVGYDGEQNILIGSHHGFPMSLRPAAAPALKTVKVAPGLAETLYTLPMDDIFHLQLEHGRSDWRWGWHGSPPRGAPSPSPFHYGNGLGWQLMRNERANVCATALVDGRAIQSAPLEIAVPKPEFDTVRVKARVRSSRPVLPAYIHYFVRFDVIKVLEGSCAEVSGEFEMHDSNGAERFLREFGASRAEADASYRLRHVGELTFARIRRPARHAGELLLMGFLRLPRETKDVNAMRITDQRGKSLLTLNDVLGYNWTTHTLHLESNVIDRLRIAVGPGNLIKGAPFQMRCGDDVAYEGVFMSAVSSRSQETHVIKLDSLDSAAIELGYPYPKYFRGVDRRGDPRLHAALAAEDLLID